MRPLLSIFAKSSGKSQGEMTVFDVHPDNERFIMVVPVSDAPQPVNVILNWPSLPKKQ
jgi:hypothetical protein